MRNVERAYLAHTRGMRIARQSKQTAIVQTQTVTWLDEKEETSGLVINGDAHHATAYMRMKKYIY